MLTDLLVYLPLVILIWTSFNLAWGVFTGLAVDHVMKYSDLHHGGHRESDQTIHAAVWICNAILFMHLFVAARFIPQCTDLALVFDIFATSFLIYVNVALSRWYNMCIKPNLFTKNPPQSFKTWLVS